MGYFSASDENDLRDVLQHFKQDHRVRNAVVIIMTDDRIIINPSSKKFKSVDHERGYGEGFQEGRNDFYNEMNNQNYGNTKRKREIFD